MPTGRQSELCSPINCANLSALLSSRFFFFFFSSSLVFVSSANSLEPVRSPAWPTGRPPAILAGKSGGQADAWARESEQSRAVWTRASSQEGRTDGRPEGKSEGDKARELLVTGRPRVLLAPWRQRARELPLIELFQSPSSNGDAHHQQKLDHKRACE